MTAIRELIEAVEAGTANHGSFAEAFINDDPQDDDCVSRAIKAHHAYTGSFDAALALMAAVLPGWSWAVNTPFSNSAAVYSPDYPGEDFDAPSYGAENNTTARALLLAILKAMEARP